MACSSVRSGMMKPQRSYEQAGGKPAYTGSAAEGAQNGETAISFADPTKAAKTGGEE